MAFDISHFGLSSKTLPAGWREDRLDTIAHFNPDQIGKGYPHTLIQYLDISNVGKGSIGKPEQLALENAPSRAKRIVIDNDTIISTVRPGNRAYAFLKKVPPNLVVSTGFAVLRSRGNDSPRFLYYLATSDTVIDYLAQIAEEKTAYPSVNPEDIAECVVPIPPVSEQEAIAHILGTLDDKIELNRRMNETLEAMAQAIFKSWFVDFLPVRANMAAKAHDPSLLLPQAEPNVWFVYAMECNDGSLYIGQTEDLRQRWLQHVGGRGAHWTKHHPPVRVPYWERQPSREAAVEREKWLKTGFGRKWLKKEIAARTQTGDPVRAKAAGRNPCLPPEIADLFPDSFQDSELGKIPEGWQVDPLPEAIAVNPSRSLRKGEVAPYLDMANMPTQGHTPNIVKDRPFGSGTRFVNGDTLVARITPCLENGKTAYVDFLEEDQVGWGSTEYIVLRPKQPLPEEFAYCLARSDSFREFAIHSMTGSSGRQRVPAESLSHYLLVVPPEQLAKRFSSVVRPLFSRARAAARESLTLAAFRDKLLPELLSGKIKLKDISMLLEEQA